MAQLKSDFVANVSHDLKTPLSVIRMFGETLEMGRVTERGQRQEYYRRDRARERAAVAAHRERPRLRAHRGRAARRTPSSPRPWSPSSGTPSTPSSIRWPARASRSTSACRRTCPRCPWTARPSRRPSPTSSTTPSSTRLSARSLTVEARLVGRRAGHLGGGCGVGIPREEQGRIFEKFYRAGRSETQGRRGSGVGLALVRHIAEAHGGRVTVESAPGAGSRFTLWLPVHSAGR